MNTKKDYLRWSKEELVSALMSWMEAHAKSESLAREAVAREAARWREAVENIVEGWKGLELNHDMRLLESMLEFPETDWLTAHDAEVAARAIEPLQRRLDATLVAALRYESRHDRDPERGKLWGELKMALMVDVTPAPAQEAKP